MSHANIQQFSIDNETHFTLIEGEIFGIGGNGRFINDLQAAARFLTEDATAQSATITSGHVIRRA